jgi:hypothetical protein
VDVFVAECLTSVLLMSSLPSVQPVCVCRLCVEFPNHSITDFIHCTASIGPVCAFPSLFD